MLKHKLPIALTATALLGFTACERDKVEADAGVDAEVDTAGVKTGEVGTPRSDEGISADMQKRLTTAEQRYTTLEREAGETRKRLEAQGAEARVEFDREVEQAMKDAKAKLESARRATAASARDAIDQLDKAIEDLDKKLEKYDQT